MSDERNDGGPAFGGAYDTVLVDMNGRLPPGTIEARSRGMSLRDWFAGQALAGMHARDTYDGGQATPEQRAHLAYIDADAMLSERNKS